MHEWLFLLPVPPPLLKDILGDAEWAELSRKTKERGGRIENGISRRIESEPLQLLFGYIYGHRIHDLIYMDGKTVFQGILYGHVKRISL